jgi:hypothetical protein
MNLEDLPVLQLTETHPADLSLDLFVLVSLFIYHLFLKKI